MIQQNSNSEESVETSDGLTKKPYKHPYFTHDEHGNVESAYGFYYNHRATPDRVQLTRSLTEDDVEDNIIDAIKWCEGIPHLYESFLGSQRINYRKKILWHESEQPFFDFIIQLIRKPKYTVSKNMYDEVMQWIEDKSPIKPSIENPIGNISSSETAELNINSFSIPPLPSGLPRKFRVVALWYTYQGITFNVNKASERTMLKEIASWCGRNTDSSGDTLGKRFSEVNNSTKRIDANEKGRQIQDRINLIKSVLDYLPVEYQSLAQSDIDELKNKVT